MKNFLIGFLLFLFLLLLSQSRIALINDREYYTSRLTRVISKEELIKILGRPIKKERFLYNNQELWTYHKPFGTYYTIAVRDGKAIPFLDM